MDVEGLNATTGMYFFRLMDCLRPIQASVFEGFDERLTRWMISQIKIRKASMACGLD